MRLTTFTDYTLRSLVYIAGNAQRTVTVADIADAHGISRHHLTKVVHQMALAGWIDTTRGRGGGIKLNGPPESINVGSVVRRSEIDFYMAECFDGDHGRCIYQNTCVLQRMLVKATDAFLQSLDGVTLKDLIGPALQGGPQAVIKLALAGTAQEPGSATSSDEIY